MATYDTRGRELGKWAWVIGVGVTLLAGGAVTMVVYLFQPWRTACPDAGEGVSGAACPMLPHDVGIMTSAFVAVVIGFIVVVIGVSFRKSGLAQSDNGTGSRARGTRSETFDSVPASLIS